MFRNRAPGHLFARGGGPKGKLKKFDKQTAFKYHR